MPAGLRALVLGTATLVALASCRSSKRGSPSAADGAPPTTISMDAARMCDLVLRAPRSKLGDCGRRKGVSFNEPESDPYEECLLQLEESVGSGRVILAPQRVEACASEVEAARRTGNPTHPALDLSVYPSCREVIEGTRGEGAECRTLLECKAPLICRGPERDGAVSDPTHRAAPAEGRCVPPLAPGQPCSASEAALLLSGRSECRGDSHCPRAIRERKPPRPLIVPEAPKVTGALPADVVERVVRHYFGQLTRCYEAALKTNADLRGHVQVRFVIAHDGAVTSAVDHGSDLADTAMLKCVLEACRSMAFPPPDTGVVTVDYPFRFGPHASDATAKSEVDVPWPGDPPPPGTCRLRANKGEPCMYTEGCQEGLVCSHGACLDGASDPPPTCQTERDCPLWSTCRNAAIVIESDHRRVVHGGCAPLAPAGAPCRSSDDCRGECVRQLCAPACDR